MSKWWQANGKRFAFEKRPPELRLLTYSYCVGPVLLIGERSWFGYAPYRDELCQCSCRHSETCVGSWTDDVLTLLIISRFFRDDASRFVCEDTWKSLKSGGQLAKDSRLLARARVAPFQFLRKVELNFEHSEYEQFFTGRTYDVPLSGGPRGRVPASVFLKDDGVPGLERLSLMFPLSSRSTQVPCQKKWTELLLRHAFDYVKHIPSVLLRGFIRLSTRRLWEENFRNAKLGLEPKYGDSTWLG